MANRERRRDGRSAGGDLRGFYLTLGAVAVIGLGVVGFQVAQGMIGRTASVPVDIEGLDDPEALVRLARGVSRGEEDAPVTIAEFADFQCPTCAYFAQRVEPRLAEELIETGRVKLVFYDSPLVQLHANAFLAARAARCAEEQGRFWAYHDELFARQSDWSGESDPTDMFAEMAGRVGLAESDFDACVASDRHAELVTANLRLAEAMGIYSTPTVLVSVPGRRARELKVLDYPSLVETIEQLTGGDDGEEGR